MLQIFKALADETRLRILSALSQGDFNVNEIIEIFHMGQSRISRHLKILADSGLVVNRREGNWIYYALAPSNGNADVADALQLALRATRQLEYYTTDLQNIESVLQRRRAISQKYFDKVGSDWERLQSEVLDSKHYREQTLALMPDNIATVIDLGVGAGLILPALFEKCQHVIALDSSQTMLKIAADYLAKELPEQAENCEFRLGELEHIPLPNKNADAAIASMVLHHVANPGDALAEIYRVLGEGGTLVIADLMQHEITEMREKYADLWLGFSPIEMMRWLKNAGFENVKYEILRSGELLKVILFKANKPVFSNQ
jgi:ArsR family transcriptional regulator